MVLIRLKTLLSVSFPPWIFVGLLVLCAGCTTMTPLQTASTVKPGVWRLGGQASVSPVCSVNDPGGFLRTVSGGGAHPFANCMVSPRGLPTPEIRAHGRRGLNDVMDLGVSAHASSVFPIGIQLGGTVDVRREVWSRSIGDNRRQILTVGPQLGIALSASDSRSSATLRPELQGDLTLPLYFGHQLEAFELVASPRYIGRLALSPGSSGVNVFDTGYLGLSLMALTRTKLQLGLGLDYFAPTGMLAGGLFTVTIGLSWDLVTAG